MKTGIIYHSYSGITRGIAERIEQEVAGELTEVRPIHPYSSLTVVAKGCYRALRGLTDQITPAMIDVSSYDLIILACPVWAGRPTPVITGAIDALSGYQGKRVFTLFTCRDEKSGVQAIDALKVKIEKKGMHYTGSCVLDGKGVQDQDRITRLIEDIRSAGQGP